jgi:hypothetical protein
MNLCLKRIKRAGRGFACFEHYRLRVLLHAGGVHLAQTSITASDQNPHTLSQRVEPHELVRWGVPHVIRQVETLPLTPCAETCLRTIKDRKIAPSA